MIESKTTQLGCLSRLADGHEIATTDGRSFLPTPPFVTVERHPGARSHYIVDRHRARLAGQSTQVYPTEKATYIADFVEMSRRTIAFLQEKRLLIPMSAGEVAKGRGR